ncbi:unnamed protein product [Caenorhabditis auriculariae]|uniref:DUF19 domain-containing protein n=1 Tax=Caenorhabditis auriculariae TaxID=2777116 RepID=A0A8S1HDE4_9PELO|nr:unnamed protein product [Caenorhabditis auriculariae]
MRLLVTASVALLATLASAQDCTSPQGTRQAFGNFLQCIKEGLDRDYGTYEDEIREHSKKAAATCFASSIEEGNSKDRCVLSVSDLNQVAWDRHGPLRDCSICRTFASGAIKAIKSTPAEDQKCIRTEISKAISREASYCLQKKIPNFAGVPEIPDLEEGSFQFKDSVISSISDHILIQSRLSFCGERKPARASTTRNCLSNPFVGYLDGHCKVLANCDSRLAVGSCAQTIPATRQATCECITEARDDLKHRIASISNVFQDLLSGNRGVAIGSANKVDICVSQIKKQMVTPVNDWVTVIDSALSTCIRNKPAGQNLAMEALLNVGCRKVIADTTGSATSQLKTGFDFVNNLIDAMVQRSGRFCGGSHCLRG